MNECKDHQWKEFFTKIVIRDPKDENKILPNDNPDYFKSRECIKCNKREWVDLKLIKMEKNNA